MSIPVRQLALEPALNGSCPEHDVALDWDHRSPNLAYCPTCRQVFDSFTGAALSRVKYSGGPIERPTSWALVLGDFSTLAADGYVRFDPTRSAVVPELYPNLWLYVTDGMMYCPARVEVDRAKTQYVAVPAWQLKRMMSAFLGADPLSKSA